MSGSSNDGDSFASLAAFSGSVSAPEAAAVYAFFSRLNQLAKEHFQGELGGKLLLYGQLDAQGSAIALAANIAGAATLGVDADSGRLRRGIRHGFCDFLVNHLDEALRILKNEVRKKQPVSVCLEGDLAATLCEAVDRGLQPDLLGLDAASEDAKILVERGAVVLGQDRVVAEPSLAGVVWTAASAPAMWLPKADALAAQALPPGDSRRRWLRFAPRYLGRTMAGSRYLEMTTEERARFAELVAEAVASGAIGAEITIQSPASPPAGLPR